MAFVFRSERNINLSGKENVTLGPGAYTGHKEYKPKPQVHQPFQAQTGRTEVSKTQMHQTAFNPGPGSYQAAAGFEQISKSMQSAKNLSMYGLEKFGITVIKPSNCFASRVDRFQDKKTKEKSHTPGPGQYVNDSEWVKSKRIAPKPEWQQITWNKMTNPPSIPSHDNVFGYEENNHGELVKQKNSDKVHTGMKKDTVGPGEYEIVKPIGADKKGPQWHLPKANKKPVPTTSDFQKEIPGPGHYNAEKVDIFPIYKYKPTSVFVSKVARETSKGVKHHGTGGNALLPPKPHSAIQQTNDDDYYDEDDDDYAPGPGSYYNPHQSTTFKVKAIPERLQFFGSTVERFHDQTDKTKIPPNVGPGSYSVQQSLAAKKIRTNNNVPFSTADMRFNDKNPAQLVPGPGSYQAKTLIENLQKKPWGKQGVFGSTEKRFVQAQTLQTPGPGLYKPERSLQALDKKNEINIKRSSSMFISQTKRNPYEDMKSKAALSVVQYDDKTNTISDQVRRKIEAGVGNPLLANLKAKRGVNPAFSSNAQRFPNKKIDEAETFLGPGYYEQQSTFDGAQKSTMGGSGSNATIAGKGQNFLSQAPRFGDQKKKMETPGPGQYSNEDLNNWFKRTYNMIFTE